MTDIQKAKDCINIVRPGLVTNWGESAYLLSFHEVINLMIQYKRGNFIEVGREYVNLEGHKLKAISITHEFLTLENDDLTVIMPLDNSEAINALIKVPSESLLELKKQEV